MFSDHQPLIARFAQSSPEGLARVIQFALLSARVPFYNMPSDLESARLGDRGTLYGHKGPGYNLAWVNRTEAYWHCMDIAYHAPDKEALSNGLVQYLASLPGLGIVKAGFAAQMAFGVSGCLDTWNVKRLGTCSKSVRNWQNYNQKSPSVRRRYVADYNRLIESAGGTQALWDTWCHILAEKYPKRYSSADDVSAIHLSILEQPLTED